MYRPFRFAKAMLVLGVVLGFGSGFASIAARHHGGGWRCHGESWRHGEVSREGAQAPAAPAAQPSTVVVQAPAAAPAPAPQIYIISPQAAPSAAPIFVTHPQAAAPVVMVPAQAAPAVAPVLVAPVAPVKATP